jgi:hypothetical protein
VVETAGGKPVYRDTAGHLFDDPDAAGASASMLPSPDFTPEQKEMAKLPLPFRNLIRDPFLPEISAQPRTTAYPQAFLDQMAAKGCSSFRIINPNLCYIRWRGAETLTDLMKEGEGRLIGPGGVETFSTQNPRFLSVMPVARPGYPIPTELASPELNYGIGG